MRMAALAAAAAVITLGTGVGARATADPGGSQVPEVASGAGGITVVDDASIVNDHPVHIESWSRNERTDSLSIHFWLPSPDCTGVHAEVVETASAMSVQVRAGTHPEAVRRMCTMIVVQAALELPLQTPVGDRTVLSAP